MSSDFEQQELGFPGARRANLRLRRGIYLLPSSMTVANMLCGFYAVMSTLKGGGTDLDNAAKAIGLAILFDSFDGFVARATGTSSEFGKQFDSLADMVSFGIAPAALGFTWGVRGIAETELLDIRRLHQIGWWVALVFVICCAWRLARFNIQGMAPGTGSKYFVGLPCPAAAGLIAATVHAIKSPIEDWRWSVFWMAVVIADAALMSSTVRYRSFKDVPMLVRQKSFFVIVIGAAGVADRGLFGSGADGHRQRFRGVWRYAASDSRGSPPSGFASRQDMTSPKEAVRVAIAGASSLRGKELNQWLEESHFPASDIRLLDEEFVAGTLTEAGGEPAVIETVTAESFERVRIAFFTGSAEFSRRHAEEAHQAGAVVIDLSGGLGRGSQRQAVDPFAGCNSGVAGRQRAGRRAAEPVRRSVSSRRCCDLHFRGVGARSDSSDWPSPFCNLCPNTARKRSKNWKPRS